MNDLRLNFIIPIVPRPPPSKIPCFSKQTLHKILSSKIKDIDLSIIINAPRQHKKMFRATHSLLGHLEFTSDHPFIYNNKFVPFEDLINLNPNFSNIEEMTYDECDTVYNIIGHPDQLHLDNIFILAEDLNMIGAAYPENSDKNYFIKKKQIMKKILNDSDPETINFIKQKYMLQGI